MKYYNQYLKATELLQNGEYDKALKMYEDLYREEPENDLINAGIAKALMSKYSVCLIKRPEIVTKIRGHIKKTQLRGIVLLGNLEKLLGNIKEARIQYLKSIKFGDAMGTYNGLTILEIALGNMENAKSYYDMYLEYMKNNYINTKSTTKYNGLYKLGLCALRLNDIDVAKALFNYLISINKYVPKSIYGLMCIDVIEENYDDAYQKYLELLNYGCNNPDDYLQLHILSKLNKLDKDYPTKNIYHKKQLLNYSEEIAKEHIKRHAILDNEMNGIFLSNISIDTLYDNCKTKIKNIGPVECWNGSGRYLIDFDYTIGINLNKPTNRVEVITILGTKDILTILPVITDNNEISYQTSSNSISENKEKVKRMSQIEKFNRKYNL